MNLLVGAVATPIMGRAPNWEWASVKTLGFALPALILLGVWVLVERHTDTPLIDLRVFRHRDVVLANGTAIGLGAAMYIGLSASSLIAQAPATTGYGIALPVFWAGFVMLPLSIGSLGANRAVRAVSHRIQLTTLR